MNKSCLSLETVDTWWRVANYLSVGQIYLLDNPLLREPLQSHHIKPRLLGHWGTCPGINLLWAHVNRLIVERDISSIFICGPGHGGPAAVANPWLEGCYTEHYPSIDWSVDGIRRLFRQFSFPGGIPSHAAPETPGSIHEGGELGYSLVHAYGAALDAPGELVVCMIGDGEAETATLAASWHAHRFLNPATDGVVLPVLHLNGWKIANPALLARLPENDLVRLFHGYGYEVFQVSGDEPEAVHEALAKALDTIADRHADIIAKARQSRQLLNVRWPVLVLRTPKGWTGPKQRDNQPVEGHFRSHQVPLGHDLGADRLCEELEQWLQSYHPEQLFEPTGAPVAILDPLRPEGDRRMSANPRTNAGKLLKPLNLPPLDAHAIDSVREGDVGQCKNGDDAAEPSETGAATGGDAVIQSAMSIAGNWLRDVIACNPDNFRLLGADEIDSNRLSAIFEATDRAWMLDSMDSDVHLSTAGRAIEVLSENLCQGLLEGYLLTGRHGIFTSYEAFIHVVDSMFNQHAKWLESAGRVSWREPLASLTYLLSSHVWRQDHNGFSHQDPGFLDVVANKRADVVRIYLPPDANSLLVVLEHSLQSRQRINVIVAGKQPEPQYLSLAQARQHLTDGVGAWHDYGTEADRGAPDVVLACAGDVPTLETVAAAALLAKHTDLSVRVVNVIDLMSLQSETLHPHGLTDEQYDRYFPPGIPTIMAFHGYPWLVHRLTYRRHHHADLHVHGFREEGTTTTPFDMAVMNRIDRFHLALAAIDYQSGTRREECHAAREHCQKQLDVHSIYIREHGEDMPVIRNYRVRPRSRTDSVHATGDIDEAHR